MSMIHGSELACNGTRKRPSSKVVVVTPQTPAALPEAACSVNLFFDVPGYGKAQATGRGATAAEATANLTATIAATRAALAPAPAEPPVRSLPQRLASLLACGLDNAVKRGDYGLGERLSKAAALVLSGAVQPGDREELLTVRSMAEPETWYEVEAGQCTCRDWTKHAKAGETYLCTHGLAALMHTRLAASH